MKLDWVHAQPSWVVVLVLIGGMMLAAEVGYQAGHRRHERTGETGRGHFGAVQASLLGLLALLLGFTFHMSSLRYHTRRELVMDHASAITALDLRSRFLPEPFRKQFRQLLRQHVDLLTDPSVLKPWDADGEPARRLAQAEAVHDQMCEVLRTELQGEHPATGTARMVTLLTKALSLQRRRIDAYESRVPDLIIGLLFGAAIAAAGAVGYSGGLGKHRGVLASVMLTLFVSSTVYVILDLDHPRRGLITIDQTPMLRVRQILDRDAETVP